MAEPHAVEIPVPAAICDLKLLDHIDYQDAFIVDTALRRTPEQWMRTIIEDAPRWFQLPWINLLGRGVLRAHIGPMSTPGYVLGWTVILDRPEVFVVGLDGAGGLRIRLITQASPGQAVLVTLIRFGPRAMRLAWPAVRSGHRFFAPYLLDRAARPARTTP